MRKKYVHTVGDYRKRTHKLFESANIKAFNFSVVSDLFGVTGRNLMNLLVSDRKSLTLEDIQFCVRGKLKDKEEELYRSIQGFFSDHHRFILKRLLETIGMLEAKIEEFDSHIRHLMKDTETGPIIGFQSGVANNVTVKNKTLWIRCGISYSLRRSITN